MREFDYFAESNFFREEEQTASQPEILAKRRRRLQLQALLIVLVSLGLAYVGWSMRDIARYHLAPQTIIDLGVAEDIKDWPVGKYVRISGITDNRKAQAHWARSLSLSSDYWYFHIAGSPLFVEVPAEDGQGHVTVFQNVRLEGRLIDLNRSPEYTKLVHFFEGTLFMRLPEQAYLLQAGLPPVDGRKFALFYGLLAMIPVLNVVVWLRAWRRLARDAAWTNANR
jgi:hypothetical protein